MLTAVPAFLSLTPTPPHPHIHLSNMTPLPTRRTPGSQPSPRRPDRPHRSEGALLYRLLRCSQTQTGRPFAPSCASLPLLCSQSWSPNHGAFPSYVGVPAVSVAARQAASSLPLSPLFAAFGSTTIGAHLMWSPPSDEQLSSPGPAGWRDKADERGRRLL